MPNRIAVAPLPPIVNESHRIADSVHRSYTEVIGSATRDTAPDVARKVREMIAADIKRFEPMKASKSAKEAKLAGLVIAWLKGPVTKAAEKLEAVQ